MRNSLLLFCFLFGYLANAQSVQRSIPSLLDSIQKDIPLEYNDLVAEQIEKYTKAKNINAEQSLNTFMMYDDSLKQIFTANDVPVELRFAALSLSQCNNNSSQAGGREGFYSLTYRVAKNHGLRITNYVDERRNVQKAAEAFCKEIKQIYATTNDWKSTLTIYIGGEVEWNKAKLISKDSTNDFWAINKHMSQEESKVYPAFVAATYFVNYYKNHGYSVKPKQELATGEVPILKHTSFYLLSTTLDIEKNKLKELNPTFKKQVVPQVSVPYTIRIPTDKVALFYAKGDTVYSYRNVEPEAEKELEKKDVSEPEKPKLPSKATLINRVKSGDALLLIADIYDCTLSQLKRWNNLRSNRINVNQRLYVKVPQSKKAYYLRMNRMSMSQKRAQAARD